MKRKRHKSKKKKKNKWRRKRHRSRADHLLCISGKQTRGLQYLAPNFPLASFIGDSKCIKHGKSTEQRYSCNFEYDPSKFNQRSGTYSAPTSTASIILIICAVSVFLLFTAGAFYFFLTSRYKKDHKSGHRSGLRSILSGRASSAKNRRQSSLRSKQGSAASSLRRSKTGKSASKATGKRKGSQANSKLSKRKSSQRKEEKPDK